MARAGSRMLPRRLWSNIEGDRGAIVSRIGSKLEATSNGRMEVVDAIRSCCRGPRTPGPYTACCAPTARCCAQCWRSERRHVRQDNLHTFALVEAAYAAAGKVTPGSLGGGVRGQRASASSTLSSRMPQAVAGPLTSTASPTLLNALRLRVQVRRFSSRVTAPWHRWSRTCRPARTR